MPDQNLLKYARARDDQKFIWRIAAAMTLKAQYQAEFELNEASRALTDWVLDHPMESLPRMVAFVSTNGTVASHVSIEDGAVDTSEVPDSDIEYVVGEKWDTVARLEYPQQAPA